MITINIQHEHLHMIAVNAKAAEIGGKSNIRGKDRTATLAQDQLVGQMGNYAGCLYLTDSVTPYIKSREAANANPLKGDDGSDMPGYRLDFKTSLMRHSNNPVHYRLIVRPRERHEGNAYVLALVPYTTGTTVHLLGWTIDDELPPIQTKGMFKGAHVVPATDLYSMHSLKVTITDFEAGDRRTNGTPQGGTHQ